MITTKAYITSVPTEGNMYRVNVPLMNDNVNTVAEFDALVCSEPTNFNNYEVGDCVYVTFEDDLYNTAVIIGKLYTENPSTTKACGVYDSLKVINSVELPEDTKLGKYSAKDIFALYQKGGSGDVDEAQLKKYVKWVSTEEEDPDTHETEDVYANKIQCMSGETYETMSEAGELEDNTLYFLSSPPPNEAGRE